LDTLLGFDGDNWTQPGGTTTEVQHRARDTWKRGAGLLLNGAAAWDWCANFVGATTGLHGGSFHWHCKTVHTEDWVLIS